MIAVSSSGRSFRALATYLAAGRSGEERERVAWSAGRNLPTDDPELAAKFMRATAAQSDRVEKPVYHIALSFDPKDEVDRATMEHVADRLLERLGLTEHQAVIVSHRDREHAHVRVFVNRVHPETGLAWERWKDQPHIQQVLREEERALGLREVAGTLAPGLERKSSVTLKRADEMREQHSPDAEVDGASAGRQTPAPLTRVDQVAQDLRTHERVAELTREHYLAQVDVSAARTRQSQLDSAAERARAAVASFDRAQASVYRNPEAAHSAYLAMVEEKSTAAASQAMKERPEQFWPLVTVDRPRALGLGRAADDSQARAGAAAAAANGRAAIEALREFGKVAADVQTRRFEDEFMRELRTMYTEPAAVRTAFHRLAGDRGVEDAVSVLRRKPAELGELLPAIRENRGRLQSHAARAAELGVEAARARTFAKSADAKTRGALMATEPAASRDAAERALNRETALRRELQSLPGRPTPLTYRDPPSYRDVLWWLAADAWAIREAEGDMSRWATGYGYPANDEATARLFDQHVRQTVSLEALLGKERLERLRAIYGSEVAASPRGARRTN